MASTAELSKCNEYTHIFGSLTRVCLAGTAGCSSLRWLALCLLVDSLWIAGSLTLCFDPLVSSLLSLHQPNRAKESVVNTNKSSVLPNNKLGTNDFDIIFQLLDCLESIWHSPSQTNSIISNISFGVWFWTVGIHISLSLQVKYWKFQWIFLQTFAENTICRKEIQQLFMDELVVLKPVQSLHTMKWPYLSQADMLSKLMICRLLAYGLAPERSAGFSDWNSSWTYQSGRTLYL